MASSKVASALAIIIQGTDASCRKIQQEKSIKCFLLILQCTKRFSVQQIIECGMDFHETGVTFSVFFAGYSVCVTGKSYQRCPLNYQLLHISLGAAKHRRLGVGDCQKLDLRALQAGKRGIVARMVVKMHSYALAPPGGHSIEISATSAANKSSAQPNEPF